MKVLFVGNGLTHYYNLVLSRLNDEPNVQLIVIVPSQCSNTVGDGVFQTREGINFQVVELEEAQKFKYYTTFKRLSDVLRQVQPDVVIVIENYLRAFLFDVSIVLAMKTIRAGLVLKTIPFRYKTYQEALRDIDESPPTITSLPAVVNDLLRKSGLAQSIKKFLLTINKRVLNLPDAYVNYVEAYEYWESYGIDREKIFITRNSPDTDMLFDVRKKLERMAPLLPPNPHRLIHVGRLVEWKRVDMLIRAFNRIRSRFPGAELIVVGTGPQESCLRSLCQELELTGAVTFTGGIYDPMMLGRYLSGSSLYVLAGMGGLSINEAMCFGLPIVCSICDGTEKMLVREGFNGCYFRDNDEDDLVEKISWMLDRPDRLRQMGHNSTDIIRNEVNISTVIDGYMRALLYASQRRHS